MLKAYELKKLKVKSGGEKICQVNVKLKENICSFINIR